MGDLLEKKKQFDNNEIKVTDLTEQELKELNKIYNKEIEELQIRIKNKMLKLNKK